MCTYRRTGSEDEDPSYHAEVPDQRPRCPHPGVEDFRTGWRRGLFVAQLGTSVRGLRPHITRSWETRTTREEEIHLDHERGHIVVGVDGSSGSRSALAFALQDAARRKATVTVVAAFAPPDFWVPLHGVPQISLDEIRDGMQCHVERTVAEVTEKLRGELGQIPPVTIRVVAGSAAQVLLETAEQADLLVVGSRGHGGISSVLLGSVSMQCTLHATSPITIVHSAGDMTEEESAPTEQATAAACFA